jgi:metallo-beta-lactamase class B
LRVTNKVWIFIIFLICVCDIGFGQEQKIKISNDLELRKISEHVYIHISYYDLQSYKHVPANGLVYLRGGESYIVDTPWTDELTRVLLDWIQDSLKSEIKGVIPTHWHQDCMGGLREVKNAGIKSYGLELTRDIARSKNLPEPAVGFRDSLMLKLGLSNIICYYVGAGHTVDNIVVWLPEERVLFGGCMVKALGQKNLGFTGDADLQEWPKSLKNLLSKFPDCRIVVPGHGAHGNLDLIHHTLKLLETNK